MDQRSRNRKIRSGGGHAQNVQRRPERTNHGNGCCRCSVAVSVIKSGNGAPTPDSELWTFGRFEVGTLMGSSKQCIDEGFVESWSLIYGAMNRNGTLPYGVAQFLTMKAYAEVVRPRPPGNIHAAQRCELVGVPLQGRELYAQVYCVAKYERRNRSVVDFQVDIADAASGQLYSKSILEICWAA